MEALELKYEEDPLGKSWSFSSPRTIIFPRTEFIYIKYNHRTQRWQNKYLWLFCTIVSREITMETKHYGVKMKPIFIK